MNRLTQKPPEHVTIGSEKCKINTNFRACLKTVMMLGDKNLTENEKQDIFFYNLYDPDYPPDLLEAVKRGMWFLRCGKEPDSKNNPVLMDFQTDADMICSAYLKAGINIDAIKDMHWWTFMAMLSELPESLFNRVVYLRSQFQKGKLTKDEREQCNRIGWDTIKMVGADELEQRRDDAAYFEEKMKKFDK